MNHILIYNFTSVATNPVNVQLLSSDCVLMKVLISNIDIIKHNRNLEIIFVLININNFVS
jgi:hypothetical protein